LGGVVAMHLKRAGTWTDRLASPAEAAADPP